MNSTINANSIQHTATVLLTAEGCHHTAFPLLAKLSQNHRHLSAKQWILLIAPPSLPTTKQLWSLNLDPSKVLVLHKHQIKEDQELIPAAINSNCYSAILSWLPETRFAHCSHYPVIAGHRPGIQQQLSMSPLRQSSPC